MRILIIHNHYKQVGGEDTVFFAEADLLAKHGHQVEKLAFSNNEVVTTLDKLQAALGVVYNPQSASLIKKKIQQFKPDVVHVHNFFPLVSPAVFSVCQRLGVPVVMTLHNYRLVCPSALLFYQGKVQTDNINKTFPVDAILKKVYRDSAFQTASVVLATGIHKLIGTWRNKVDRFIVLTPGAAGLFQHSSLRPKQGQLVVKPNFTADLGVGADSRADYFLFVGRLTTEKGVETLLKAHQLHPFPLKIIGDGPLADTVAAYAAENATVAYLGFQGRERVVQELKQAKALIFPSEWHETFGMTIVEAFSTATPAIAARIGGAAHLVQDGYNGLLYTPGAAAELAEKVKLLQQDVSLIATLAGGARRSYEQSYTPEANYRMLSAIYEDVIASKKAKAHL
ncbi:glycosyltransferase family 4 protein [Pontibacter beigongshangensis]|uniref:glycosyltransferase family 4 protein n=1 Tax=Pontibacter beigongshangensis TaxID=2574733 RepID=UPI00164FC572|nr:glycosyltransferase family 4 protein [Pontibacter beigongshangensis]